MALAISMVLFSDDVKVSYADFQSDLSARWPDLPAATEVDEAENTFLFRLGETTVILGKMPAPFPWSDLEGPCATSVLWRNAAETLKEHKTHVIVTVNGEHEPVELATLLTQVTSSLMAASPTALGVYWGNATLVVPKEIFVDVATEIMPHGPPFPIWLDFRVGPDGENTSAGFTTGMAALGHMELETKNATEPPGELRDRFLGLADYLVENGPVISDGDTIGQDHNERIRVVYSDSEFGHKEQVMRLVYEATATAGASKPWWKFW